MLTPLHQSQPGTRCEIVPPPPMGGEGGVKVTPSANSSNAARGMPSPAPGGSCREYRDQQRQHSVMDEGFFHLIFII